MTTAWQWSQSTFGFKHSVLLTAFWSYLQIREKAVETKFGAFLWADPYTDRLISIWTYFISVYIYSHSSIGIGPTVYNIAVCR